MKNIDEVCMKRDGTLLAIIYVAVMLRLNFKKGDHKVHGIFVQLTCIHKTLLMEPPLEKNNDSEVVSGKSS